MKSKKVSYQWPELMATKTGKFWVSVSCPDKLNPDIMLVYSHAIKFQEVIKDPDLDAEKEIDFDFPFLENISIPCYKGRKEFDFILTLNCN